MRLYGSLINRIGEQNPTAPQVGDGATEYHYTDRYPYTVVEVVSPRMVRVQADRAIRTDTNGQSEAQRYTYERQPDAPVSTLTLRANGQWRRVGESVTAGAGWSFGVRDRYYDYSY